MQIPFLLGQCFRLLLICCCWGALPARLLGGAVGAFPHVVLFAGGVGLSGCPGVVAGGPGGCVGGGWVCV